MTSRFKGVSNVVSISLITAFIIVSVVIVLTWALPLVQSSQNLAEMQRMKMSLATLDDYIRTVSHSGNGTTRTISMQVRQGELMMSNGSISYFIDVGEPLIKNNVTISEKNVWLTGVGNGVRMKINYSSIEVSANGALSGNGQIRITKIGEKNGKPLVEVKEI